MKSRLSLVFAVLIPTMLAAQASAPKERAKCVVGGQVIQEPGARPIRKANIELTPDDQEEGTSHTAVTDPEGRFKIDNIEPGRYTLSVQHSGFSGERKHRRGRSLTLDPGQEMKDLVFRLQATAVITGKIVDNDGDPVPNARVFVTSYQGPDRRRGFAGIGQTNDLGEYRISNLESGRYLITANPEIQFFQRSRVEGHRKPVPYITYYPGTTDKAQAVPVELHSGDELPANLALTYGPAFRIRGTVSGIPATEIAGLSVMLGSKDAGWPMGASDAEVKKDGSFEIHNVLPGSYFVWLMNSTGTPEAMFAAQTIEVKDSDLENVRLTPVSTSEVRGLLRMENGQKADWADVSLFLQSSDDPLDSRGEFGGQRETTTAQVKQDGSFDMKTVPAGNYNVRVFSGLAALRDCFMKSVNAGGKDVADSGFTVSGGTLFLDVVLSSNGAHADGVVVDEKNQPVADAEVVVIPEATRQKRRDLYQQGTTDQDGHFNVPGLNPGEYTVMALEDLEDDFRDPEFVKLHKGIGQNIHVDEGEHKSISLRLASPANDVKQDLSPQIQ
jgi:hypothetical protein